MSHDDHERSTEINSLFGVKAVAMLALFWWHCPLDNPAADLGARMCEILFVVSGFLVGINHWEKQISVDHGSAISYVKKKAFAVWPLHFMAFLIDFAASLIANANGILTWKTGMNAVVNLTFMQAWSRDMSVYFSFNGATWFLSALFFCYFISPVLVDKAKKLRFPVVALILVLTLRILLEQLNTRWGWNGLSFDYHVSPIIRAMEFFAGLLLVPVYHQTKKLASDETFGNVAAFTVAEVVALGVYIWCLINKSSSWIRGNYIPIICVMVLALANDRGLLSMFLGAIPFRWFASVQLEFFVLHQAILHLYARCIHIPQLRKEPASLILFMVTLILAMGYRQIILWIRRARQSARH